MDDHSWYLSFQQMLDAMLGDPGQISINRSQRCLLDIVLAKFLKNLINRNALRSNEFLNGT